MNTPKFLLLLSVTILFLTGCDTAMQPSRDQVAPATKQAQSVDTKPALSPVYDRETVAKDEVAEGRAVQVSQQVSLNQVDQSQSMAEAMNRKILRNANLTLEVKDPGTTQRQITSIAESLGGFVVLSESKQRQTANSASYDLEVNVVVRIPASQFNSALEQIRAQSSRVITESATGQDVTEEFIDLEARIKTQKALELQFLEIMKQSRKVSDALEVQSQIAEVRTEIEKLEGRKRFLENRASLSTITIKLQTPTAIVVVSTSGFGRNIREAVADSVAIAGAIVLFLIRSVIVMIPILVLVVIPGGLLTRYAYRRARRMQLASVPSSSSEST